jgi:hypothetical protein
MPRSHSVLLFRGGLLLSHTSVVLHLSHTSAVLPLTLASAVLPLTLALVVRLVLIETFIVRKAALQAMATPATLRAMAMTIAGGDTAAGDVMAPMPMAVVTMRMPTTAATTGTATATAERGAFWFAPQTE